jgi:multidrug efflux pump subunit AcrB
MAHVTRRWKAWLLVLGIAGSLCALVLLAVVAWTIWPSKVKASPAVVVVTYHPGMTASSIEKDITNHIERWVNQHHAVERVTSRSVPGVSIVRVFFRNDMDPTEALTATGELALGALPSLPPNIVPPVVLPFAATAGRPVGILTLSSPNADEAILKGLAQMKVRDRLAIIPGAVVPVILGGKDRRVIVTLDPAKMQAHHLVPHKVVEALRTVSLHDTPTSGDQLCLENKGCPLDTEELLAVSLDGVRGDLVTLGHVGQVKDGYAPQTARFRLDSRRGVGLPVFRAGDADPKAVGEQASQAPASLQGQLPPDVQLQWIAFGSPRWWDPSGDDGLLTIHVRAPASSSLDEFEKRVIAVERFLDKSIPAQEREAILAEVGMEANWSAVYTENAGPQDGTIHLQLSRARTLSATAYASKLRGLIHQDPAFADLGIRFTSKDMPAPVDLRIQGGTPEDQQRLAQDVYRRLQTIQGAVDVEVAQRLDTPNVILDHVNLARVLDVRTSIEGRNRRDVIADIQQMLQQLRPLDGMTVELAE